MTPMVQAMFPQNLYWNLQAPRWLGWSPGQFAAAAVTSFLGGGLNDWGYGSPVVRPTGPVRRHAVVRFRVLPYFRRGHYKLFGIAKWMDIPALKKNRYVHLRLHLR